MRAFLRSNKKLSLPPGPKGLPLVGNILDMPSEKEWLTFARWGELYGDICSVTVLGQPLIVVNSSKNAIDMLDKKSAIYSDRPVLLMGGELVGWKNTMVLLPYGDRFRRYRRLFHNLIGNQTAVKRFRPSQQIETRRFLRRILLSPNEFSDHVRRTVGAVILKISHGYEVEEKNDPFIEMANKATEQFSLATAPGGFLVDLVPFLRHLPAWFPGAGFRRKANIWAATLQEMVDRPHDFVRQNMARGTAEVSFTSAALQGKQLSPDEELDLKWSAASLYSGAADTTVAAINSFFLAIALHPRVLKKAQEEIDAVVGLDRLPTYDDRMSLPYINALIMEVLRWHTVVPTGESVAHRLLQDDIHDGYLIPKGSLILPNIWYMTHDPKVYKDPFEFKPERFLALKGRAPESDPREVCFGFGRRICPGLHLADASLFITCAMTLAVFDVSKHTENGVIIEPNHENTTGTISHPAPFKCSIKPRSERAVSLILAEES
ncbi:cytochrome P450 [Pholiota conissans]|uniref:Cytochrome P450 n=1 Tax=Pholiota conissans TaxID=109636 RepID=A0A9P5Z9G0_9AGAR|nr:cytochrome P450 [Pholiota conissans]